MYVSFYVYIHYVSTQENKCYEGVFSEGTTISWEKTRFREKQRRTMMSPTVGADGSASDEKTRSKTVKEKDKEGQRNCPKRQTPVPWPVGGSGTAMAATTSQGRTSGTTLHPPVCHYSFTDGRLPSEVATAVCTPASTLQPTPSQNTPPLLRVRLLPSRRRSGEQAPPLPGSSPSLEG